jgi:hypothetical protein
MDIDFSLEGLLVNKEDEQYREKSAKQEKKLDTGIEK